MTTPVAPGVYVKEASSGVRSVVGAGTSTPAFLGITATYDKSSPETFRPRLVRSWTEFCKAFFPTPPDAVTALDAARNAYKQAAQRGETLAIIGKEVAAAADDFGKAKDDKGKAAVAAALVQNVDKAIEIAKEFGASETDSGIKDLKTAAGSLGSPTVEKVKEVETKYGAAFKSWAEGFNSFASLSGDLDKVYESLNGENGLSSDNVFKQKEALSKLDSQFKAITSPAVGKHQGLGSLKSLGQQLVSAVNMDDGYLGEAVLGFFANGGGSCYIVPVKKGAAPAVADILGKDDIGDGLAGLAKVHEVSMVAVPDLPILVANAESAAGYMQEVVGHCARIGNRLAIVDPLSADALPDAAVKTAQKVTGRKDLAAFYYPWVVVSGANGKKRAVPPCGHLAGVWAATDNARGVFKAPANVSLTGAINLSRQLSDDEQGNLNEHGVNCLRDFPGRPLMVWGARTLADPSDRDWKYLSVRRLVCFLSDSIRLSTNWAVFEPNDERLWSTLRQSVIAFLKDQWRQGALQGTTADQAFHVVCDQSNNPQSLIDLGQVHCDVYIAPVRPAEFIHFTIQQTAGQSPS